MSDKDLFAAIRARDLVKVNKIMHSDFLKFEVVYSCGYCDKEIKDGCYCSSECAKADSDADLRARLDLEARSEPRESWSNIDEQSGMPKSGPLD